MELPNFHRSLLFGPFLLWTTFYLLLPQEFSASITSTSFPCTTFRDCNPNERCLENGFCGCKFGYTIRRWSTLRRPNGRTLSFVPSFLGGGTPYYCDLFTCTGNAACQRLYGSWTSCRNFACTCSEGASVDFSSQKCVKSLNGNKSDKVSSSSNIPAWVYWIWRRPQALKAAKTESLNSTEDENVLSEELKTKANYSELAFIKCFTTAQCRRQFGPETVCSPATRQCELRTPEMDEASSVILSESSFYYLLFRWAIIGAILLLAVFCVCRSSFSSSSSSSSSSSKDSER